MNTKNKVSISLLLVYLFLSFLFVAQVTGSTQYDSWKDVVEYKYSSIRHYEKDSSRKDPTPNAYVLFSFTFVNETHDKNIKKIIFRAKFSDPSGYHIRTTGNLELEPYLGPGQVGGSQMGWYYENEDYSPYNKLASYVKENEVEIKVDLKEIVLGDGTVLDYPGINWIKQVGEREKDEKKSSNQGDLSFGNEAEFVKNHVEIQSCSLEPNYYKDEVSGWYVESGARNTSSEYLRGVEVKVVFRNNGKFVTYNTDYLEPMDLKPGETGHFHVYHSALNGEVDSASCSVLDGWVDED